MLSPTRIESLRSGILHASLPLLLLLACHSSDRPGGGSGGSQATGGAGGKAASGGATGKGGSGSGGSTGTGGASAVGGSTTVGTGGVSSGGGTSTGAGGAGGGSGGASAKDAASTGGSDAATSSGGAAGGAGGSGGTGSGTGGTGTGGSTVGGWLKCADLTSTKLSSEYAAWKKGFAVDCGTDKARVHKGSNTSVSNTTVSEGIGYGMLIAAGMRDCDLVKKLHKFYLAAQAFTNNPANAQTMKGNGLMPWSLSSGCDTNTVDDANFASDADLDVAMGLLQGSSVCTDSYDYKGGAVTVINALKKNAFLTSGGKTILKGGGVGTSINPSYFSMGYFRAFAKAVPADTSFWQQAITDAYPLLASYQNATSGKFPDWGNADGTPSGGFSYDACRVPWRIATDFAWSSDPNAKTLLDKFRTTGMGGKLPYAATDQHNSAFVGAMALSAISADQATMDSFCTDWLKRTNGSGGELDDTQYYQATLRLVYMMLASGMAVSTL